MLLADPCFQLRSISYLLGQPEPPAPGTALPAPDRKHFSLQSCKWARGGSGKTGIWGWVGPVVLRANSQAGNTQEAPGSEATFGLTLLPPHPHRRYRLHQCGGAGPGGTDAGTPNLCICAGGSCLPGEWGHTSSLHISTTVCVVHTHLPGRLTQPTLHSAPCSPPVRKTSAPSATLTPSLLCSSPVATSPASTWAPWAQWAACGQGGIHWLYWHALPCCRACIDQHLMNNKDCFFCKATIVSVEDWDKAANASATSSAA